MKSAGYLVSATAEFSAGMKYRKYNFNSGNTGFMVDTYGDSASVIDYGDRVIGVYRNFDLGTESGKRLIYRIVHDLVYQMMKSS